MGGNKSPKASHLLARTLTLIVSLLGLSKQLPGKVGGLGLS